MKKFSTRKLFKVIVIVAIFGILIFLNPVGFFNPLESIFGKITSPFEKFSYSISHKTSEWSGFIFSIGKLKEENQKILRQNQELISENARLHDIERENNFLREQVGMLPLEKFELEPAFVISQDPKGLGNLIEISKGSKDDIKEGMAVIVSKGVLIGKIEKVFSNRSLVTLITNPKSVINIVVSQTGSRGLARGEYGLGIIADSILQTDSISIGNEIVTSGIGSEVPKGLLIGNVQEIRSSDDHLFSQAVISSPVNISDLEIVFVIKKNK